MFINDEPTLAPVMSSIDSLFNMLKSNVVLTIVAVLLLLLVIVVVFKLPTVLDLFKDLSQKKHDLEMKKMDDARLQSDRGFATTDKLSEVVSNNTEALVALKEAHISMDARSEQRAILNDAKSAERSLDLKTYIGDKFSNMENRFIDKITRA